MTLRLRVTLAALALGLAVAGCQEQLTAPGSCPATCPGGSPQLRDTILDAVLGGDSTHTGYVVRGATAGGLRVSNGLLGDTNYGFIRFGAVPDSISVRDTMRSYTIDSVVLNVSLIAHDTTVSGTLLELHRLPLTVDTGSTYADIAPSMGAATLLDTVTIADTVHTGHNYTFTYKGAALSQVAIPAGDSGVLALGVAISGATATGVRVGGLGSSSVAPAPVFLTYVTVDVPDTAAAVKHQSLRSIPKGTRYFSKVTPVDDPDLLTLGTAAGARAMIRFPFPAYLKDSALISRATLELTPADTIRGLRGDSAIVDVDGIIADFGAKSPQSGLAGFRVLTLNSADTVRIEVGTEVKNWQRATLAHPPAFVLTLNPEGASFTEPRFYSTRSASGHPRLHVTYQLPFAFERP